MFYGRWLLLYTQHCWGYVWSSASHFGHYTSKTGQISKKSNEKVENSAEGLREVGLLSLKQKVKNHYWQILLFVKGCNKDKHILALGLVIINQTWDWTNLWKRIPPRPVKLTATTTGSQSPQATNCWGVAWENITTGSPFSYTLPHRQDPRVAWPFTLTKCLSHTAHFFRWDSTKPC